ncbi:MAG: hypothetical protein D6798_06175 [Deltaproteobacteria bacterium]|nr:MAG: hypothetical protein D6798_06175 [Deltaproteobacteria bacterium]
MQTVHLTFSAEGRLALFPDEAARRRAVRALARVGGDALLLFCVVDDHVHVVVRSEPDRTGRLARALLLALRAVAADGILPAHLRPVTDRAHLQWLVRYVLHQPAKHALGTHPALWSGSCLPDLVGARVLPGAALAATLAAQLPRLRQRTLFEAVGLPPQPLEPVTDEQLRGLGLADLVAASSAAVAADPALAGRDATTTTARSIAAQLGSAAGFRSEQLAWALHVSAQAVRRYRRRSLDPALVRAARLQLALVLAVRALPPAPVPAP